MKKWYLEKSTSDITRGSLRFKEIWGSDPYALFSVIRYSDPSDAYMCKLCPLIQVSVS